MRSCSMTAARGEEEVLTVGGGGTSTVATGVGTATLRILSAN